MKSVLFYSFKGGVGRTQTMINIAKYLSNEKNKKILIIDFDIYAPGISYLSDFDQDKKGKYYLLEYLLELFKGNPRDLYYEEYKKNLFIVPSSHTEHLSKYHSLLTELSQYLYSLKVSVEERKSSSTTVVDDLYKYIIKSIEKMNLNLDYVFFDSRTGITEVSDILFSNSLDLKVFVSSFNNQNINGTNNILKILSEQSGIKHNILRVLSPKPIDFDEKEYKEIEIRANLDNNELKSKFTWHGTHEVSYDTKIVTNDEDVWEDFTNECIYRKQIISIASKIDNICYSDDELESIISKI